MRMIDADALKDYLKSLRYESKRFNDREFTFLMCMLTENLRKDIDRQPTIELKRKKGKWIKDRLVTTSGGTYGVIRCSECEHYFQDVGYGWDYCPNCGSYNGGEQHEND